MNANLSGVNFSAAVVNGVDFTGANLKCVHPACTHRACPALVVLCLCTRGPHHHQHKRNAHCRLPAAPLLAPCYVPTCGLGGGAQGRQHHHTYAVLTGRGRSGDQLDEVDQHTGRGANFTNAVLTGSNFKDADLVDTVWEDATVGAEDVKRICRCVGVCAGARA